MTQSEGLFEEKRKSLEEEFLHRESQRQLENLRQVRIMEQSREELSQASGIQNEVILDRLLELGITAQTVAALAVVPLVEVVWADGHLDEKEKQAFLQAAGQFGLSAGSVNYDLLESWLSKRPDRRLRQSWREYIQGLCEELKPEEREALKSDLLRRARDMAEASGGILGLGSKISKAEMDTLEELADAFPGSD